ncbi:capsid portal protein [Sphingomonas panacis]|uniref:Capsid portal protein n=1 Tax=Sphingomonas panacis TaxID=1560345 RepID=A0A1B3Z848_9SPHN|nr:phage portal protein [Sphingomonas panacis]AOH83608.1 capsid portal protein [Sphingomonas panacis]
MSRRNKAQAMSRAETAAAATGAIDAKTGASTAMQAFTFGDPEPVLNRREIIDMIECVHNGRWYEPPIPLDGLARAYRVSPHHSSAIMLKRNLLVSSFDPTPFLSRKAFAAFVQDYLVFGTAYLEQIRNVLGGTMRLDHVLSKYTRRGLQAGQFFFLPAYGQESEFRPGSIVQVMQADVNQEIYGVPEYLSALQSALLNEAATLFRRRYYLNGSHAGYILYATGDIDDNDTAALRDALKASKGPGNFKNLFVHAPGGKDGSLKILPIAEVGAKDEFLGIKNVTRDDVLAAHRTPPALLGIVPAQGSSGFGNPLQATDMFFELEIEPIQANLLDVNDQVGFEAIRFKERVRSTATAA